MKTAARELFAKRVQELREERGWSQDDLVKAARLSPAYIGAVERAEQSIGLDEMEKIANALKVPIFELLQNSSAGRVTH